MIRITLEEAERRLADLVDEAAAGEEVIIRRGDGAAFQILPLSTSQPRPRFGSAKGLIRVPDDFDEPLPDFEDYKP
ncbi:prevent-host-death protein [bacterium]|nr:MAG: prevent-host-death protein [bacterium]